eukprot:1518356-Pyramimonas_sp.AAC.1
MKKSSGEGGCSGTNIDIEEHKQQVASQHRPVRDRGAAFHLARQDWGKLRTNIWKLKLWKPWPAWSCPVEALRLVLHPSWVNKRVRPEYHGLGYAEGWGDHFPRRTRGLFHRLLVTCRIWNRTPYMWHAADAR